MNSNVALNFNKRRCVNKRLGLGVDGIGSKGIGNGGNGLHFLLLLALHLCVVKLNVTLKIGDSRTVVRGSLLELLLLLGILLLVRWGNDTPASSPGDASAEADSNPSFGLESGSLHDDIDVVKRLALTGDKRASVGFLQDRVFIHGKADASSPLDEGVVGVEVEKVAVLSSRRDAQNILQRLLSLCAGRKRLNLQLGVSTCPPGVVSVIVDDVPF